MRKWFISLALALLALLALVRFTEIPATILSAPAPQAQPAMLNGLASYGLDSFAFSPDGHTLASVDTAGAITLSDLATGQAQLVFSGQLGDPATALEYSPDGTLLASIGDSTIMLWGVAEGQARATLSYSGSAPLNDLVISPRSDRVAGLTADGQILLWNVISGGVERVLPAAAVMNGVTFSPDGALLAGASSGATAQLTLWEAATGHVRSTLSATGNATFAPPLFSPDGRTVASVTQGARITLLDAATGSVRAVLASDQAHLNRLAFSPDGTVLASGGDNAQIELWDLATGQILSVLRPTALAAVTDLLFSRDGTTLASVGADYTISLWDVATGELRHMLVGHSDLVTKIAFGPDAATLASLGKNGEIIVWDVATGMARRGFQLPLLSASGAVRQPGTAPAGQVPVGAAPVAAPATTAATTNQAAPNASAPARNANAKATDNNKDKKKKKAKERDWKGVTALAISVDGTDLGTGGADGTVRVFKKNGQARWKVKDHHGSAVAAIAFRGKAKEWVSVGRDTEVTTRRNANGKSLQTFRGPEHPPRTVAVSPTGQFIAVAGEETRIFLFDADAGKLLRIFTGHTSFVNALAFSPDGKRLASAGTEGLVLLWEVATGQRVLTLRGHVDEVNAVAFSPDGTRLASGGADSQVLLWNPVTGQPLRVLAGHQGGVRAVAFSPNGKKLVSGGEDTRLLVWDPETGLLKKQLAGPPAVINALAFSPDGNLEAASENSDVTEFNGETGEVVEIVPVVPEAEPQASRSEALPRAAATVPRFLGQLLDWLLPAANAALPNPDVGWPGSPILVINSAASPSSFGQYYAEILRNEGLNAFAVADISSVTAATLASYDVVLLAAIPLLPAQATLLSEWVTAGGNLIAMRPDPQLAGLLGITPTGTLVGWLSAGGHHDDPGEWPRQPDPPVSWHSQPLRVERRFQPCHPLLECHHGDEQSRPHAAHCGRWASRRVYL